MCMHIDANNIYKPAAKAVGPACSSCFLIRYLDSCYVHMQDYHAYVGTRGEPASLYDIYVGVCTSPCLYVCV